MSCSSKSHFKKVVKVQEKYFRKKLRETMKTQKLLEKIIYYIEHNQYSQIKFYFRHEKYKLVFMDNFYYVVLRKKARYIFKFNKDYLILSPIEPIKIG